MAPLEGASPLPRVWWRIVPNRFLQGLCMWACHRADVFPSAKQDCSFTSSWHKMATVVCASLQS